MDEPTSKTAFNNAAPGRVVKVNKNNKKKALSRSNKKSLQGSATRYEPSNLGYAPIMHLDVEKYLHEFKDFVMTEEEKIEVLETMWSIMCRFVELGFGLDANTLACAEKRKKPRIENGILVDLDPSDNP